MRTKRIHREPCQMPGCTVKEAHYGRVCARHSVPRAVIPLTKPQAEWLDWALNGPISEWGYPDLMAEERDITIEEAKRAILDRDITELRMMGTPEKWSDNCLIIGQIDPKGDFIIDLLNMLEDVAPDVEDGYGFDEADAKHGYEAAHVIVAARKKAARNVAEKIRKALGI